MPENILILHFNSNMVRLRVADKCSHESEWDISIPTWYDWEEYLGLSNEKLERNFNSNMVRLRVRCIRRTRLKSMHFNSNMVRLRGWVWCLKTSWFCISIPTWYDWETRKREEDQERHFYFNSNMVRLRAVTRMAVLAQFKGFFGVFLSKKSSMYNCMILQVHRRLLIIRYLR